MNRSRTAGHNFERDIVRELKSMGFDAVTSRQESRAKDNAGIDIITSIPIEIQCKCAVTQPNFHKLLTLTKATVVFYRKVQKQGKKFMVKGDYVCMPKELFYREFLEKKYSL